MSHYATPQEQEQDVAVAVNTHTRIVSYAHSCRVYGNEFKRVEEYEFARMLEEQKTSYYEAILENQECKLYFDCDAKVLKDDDTDAARYAYVSAAKRALDTVIDDDVFETLPPHTFSSDIWVATSHGAFLNEKTWTTHETLSKWSVRFFVNGYTTMNNANIQILAKKANLYISQTPRLHAAFEKIVDFDASNPKIFDECVYDPNRKMRCIHTSKTLTKKGGYETHKETRPLVPCSSDSFTPLSVDDYLYTPDKFVITGCFNDECDRMVYTPTAADFASVNITTSGKTGTKRSFAAISNEEEEPGQGQGQGQEENETKVDNVCREVAALCTAIQEIKPSYFAGDMNWSKIGWVLAKETKWHNKGYDTFAAIVDCMPSTSGHKQDDAIRRAKYATTGHVVSLQSLRKELFVLNPNHPLAEECMRLEELRKVVFDYNASDGKLEGYLSKYYGKNYRCSSKDHDYWYYDEDAVLWRYSEHPGQYISLLKTDVCKDVEVWYNESLVAAKAQAELPVPADKKEAKQHEKKTNSLEGACKKLKEIILTLQSTCKATAVLKMMHHNPKFMEPTFAVKIDTGMDFCQETKLLDRTTLNYLLPMRGKKVMDIRTLQQYPRTREHYFTYEMSFDYKEQLTAEESQNAHDYFSSVFVLDRYSCVPCPETLQAFATSIRTSLQGLPLKKFFVMIGEGHNGKSMMMNMIESCCGKSMACLPNEVVVQKSNGKGGATPELIDTTTTRIGRVNEVECTDRLNSASMKMISGNDSFSARKMYCNYSRMIATCSLWILSNELMQMDTSDDAVTKRLTVFPCRRVFDDNDTIEKTTYQNKDVYFSWLLQHGQFGEDKIVPSAMMLAEKQVIRKEGSAPSISNFMTLSDRPYELSKSLRSGDLYGGWPSQTELYCRYQTFCKRCNYKDADILTPTKFTKALVSYFGAKNAAEITYKTNGRVFFRLDPLPTEDELEEMRRTNTSR